MYIAEQPLRSSIRHLASEDFSIAMIEPAEIARVYVSMVDQRWRLEITKDELIVRLYLEWCTVFFFS